MKFRKAVFVVTYSKTNKGIEYLILKRKLHWKGWEFPKGGIKGKNAEKSTVKREVIEETSLVPIKTKKFKVSGKYKYKKPLKDRPGILGQSYKLFSAEVKKKKINIKKNPTEEHSDAKWVDFKTALNKLTWPNQRKCLKVVNTFLEKSSIKA